MRCLKCGSVTRYPTGETRDTQTCYNCRNGIPKPEGKVSSYPWGKI